MLLPDILSRIPNISHNIEDEIEVSYVLQENEIPLFKDIQAATQNSEIIQIIRFIQKGWPKRIQKKWLPYTKNKFEYTVHNGCLYRGLRIVVPPVLRQKTLQLFHEYHPGIARMRQLMRQFVWWPNMDMAVQKHVNNCTECALNQASRTNWQLTSWPESKRFFQSLFIDICFYEKNQYLVIIDSFSNFTDVHNLSSLTSKQIILALNKTFRYFGLPETLVCDHGSQFLSKEFREFLKINSIELILTPPYHSQSNGKVERAIRSLKLFLTKNKDCPSVDSYCRTHNFFPNSNGIIPATEYLKIQPRVLMKKILVSDKRGASSAQRPDTNIGSAITPLDGSKVAHTGGVIELGDRVRIPNKRYFNENFSTK
jgi:transposase InsO family protein